MNKAPESSSKSISRTARRFRVVAFVWLVWGLLCLLFLRMSAAFGIGNPLGVLGIVAVVLWIAVSLCPLVLLTLLVPIAFHELGHVIAGLPVGYSPKLVQVGPLCWRLNEGRWRFYWDGNVKSLAGLAACSPKPGTNPRTGLPILILGGPLASFVLALPGASQGYQMALLRPLFHTPVPPRDQSPLISLMMILGMISAVALISSLLPIRIGPFRSDGSALWIFFRGGRAAQRYAAVMAIAVNQQLSIAATGWPSNWIEDATALPDGKTDDAYGCYYAYLWHIARRDYPAARKAILRATAATKSLPADHRAQVHLDAAEYYLRFDGDLERAQFHFELGKSSRLATAARIQDIQTQIATARLIS